MSRRFRFRGLAVQIVLWTVLPLTLVLIGVAFTGITSHERAMRTLVEERDQALAVVSAAEVREIILERGSALEELANQPGLAGLDAAAQRMALAQAGTLNGLFADELVLLDGSGTLVATADPAPAWTEAGSLLASLAMTITAEEHLALSPVFDVPGGPATFVLGVPVYGPTGHVAGVLAGAASADSLRLSALISQAQVGQHGAIYLVDESGRVLAHSPTTQPRSSFAGHSGLATAQQADCAGATQCLDTAGNQMALAYAPVGVGNGWQVIVEEPWHEVVSPVLRYSQFMPLVAALAAVIALLTLYYGVYSLARPLRALKRQAEQVASGDFDAASSPVGGVQEIEDLQCTLDQMARRIQGYQRGMHDYIAAITQGQEEERRRLARELHDDTAQSLIALGQQVEMAQKLLATSPERAGERLATVRSMLAEALEGVRRFSRDLRPIYLEDLGFIPALEMLAREASQRQGLAIDLSTAGAVRRLPPDLELAAYRIVQEGINNILQHAQASQAWVQVRFEPEHLWLSIRDDGEGYEAPDLPDVMARQGHFGLMGIRERALLYGGTLAIQSAPSQGTELTVRLAYPAG